MIGVIIALLETCFRRMAIGTGSIVSFRSVRAPSVVFAVRSPGLRPGLFQAGLAGLRAQDQPTINRRTQNRPAGRSRPTK